MHIVAHIKKACQNKLQSQRGKLMKIDIYKNAHTHIHTHTQVGSDSLKTGPGMAGGGVTEGN